MKKVQKLLRRSLATGLALVMTVSSMTIVPGSWQVHAAEASGQIGISNADELKKIGKDKDYPMDGDYVLTDDIDLSGSDWTPIGGSGGSQYALVSGERVQVFEGTVLKKQGGSNRATFTVRKSSNGVGVEKTWPLHSPHVVKVEVIRRGKVRRAKLNYLRDRVGKAAKVKELVK